MADLQQPIAYVGSPANMPSNVQQAVLDNSPPAGMTSTKSIPPPAQTQAQQALSFTNPYTELEQAQINAMPLNNKAAQATAAQAQTSPLAGLTVLGQTANAGLAQAGMQNAGLYGAGSNTAGLYTAGPTTIDSANSNNLLGGQLANINALHQQANGLGPSVAAQQAQMIAGQNVQNQMAMLGSQRGSSNPALAQRAGQEMAAQANQQAVQVGALGRAQEAMQAQQALTNALQGTQGQVMGQAANQAQLYQQNNLANLGSGNQQQQFNAGQLNQLGLQNAQMGNVQQTFNSGQANQLALQNAQMQNQQQQFNAAGANQGMLQQGSMNQQIQLANQGTASQTQLANLSASQQTQLANLQAAQQVQGLNANEYNAMIQAQMALANTNLTASENYANLVAQQNTQAAGIAAGVQMNAANNQMGLIGAGIAGGAGLAAAGISAMSDRTQKANIRSATRGMKDFLSQIGSSPSFALLEGNI